MPSTLSSERPGLIRALGPVLATAVVVGTVIGSGVFKKPQVVAENVPYFGIAALVWVLGGLLALLGGLVLAEIAVLYPRAGGNYVFLREGYGPMAGFLFGWVEFWIIRSASIAALATIFTESLHDILRSPAFQTALGIDIGPTPLGFWEQRWVTVGTILILAGINVLGVRWGGLLQLFITLIKVGSLVGLAALPFFAFRLVDASRAIALPRSENLLPIWPSWQDFNLGKMGTALVGVLWAYHGWMNIAPVAEEVRNPRRNIPLALFGGIGIIVALYLGANLSYCLVMPQSEIAAVKSTPVATEFCLRLLGPLGAAAASGAIMCSVFGALSGNLLVGPRLLYAMGEDGLAPRALGRAHPRFRTPALAIGVLGIWSCLLITAGAALTRYDLPVFSVGGWSIDVNLPKYSPPLPVQAASVAGSLATPGGQGPFLASATLVAGRAEKPLFDVMTDFAIFGAVIFETLAVTTIFAFRRRYPNRERPYRCPGYPFVPLLYPLIMSFVAVNMFVRQRTEALTGVAFIALGAAVYGLIRLRGNFKGTARE
jgi:amino acid transporter